MDVCLPVCKVGFSVSSLQSGVLSLQTGAGRKRCDLHVSRSANCDTQFANWCSLQIRRASLASSLHTELSSRLICKLRPSLQTAAKVSPSLQTGLSLQTAPVRRLRPTYRRRKDRLKRQGSEARQRMLWDLLLGSEGGSYRQASVHDTSLKYSLEKKCDLPMIWGLLFEGVVSSQHFLSL